MLALHDWQQQLQHAILGQKVSANLLQSIRLQGVIPEQRIGIYRDAYRLRLTEALASNYPALALYMAEETFKELANHYIVFHPSRHASIRWFGDVLESFLQTQAPWSANSLLHELARFEWALRHTVDATDRPVLESESLETLPAEYWPELLLQLQPAASILFLKKNIPTFWHALMEQQTLPELQDNPQHWLVYRRQDLMAMWRSMGEEEARLLLLLQTGIGFADLCEAIAENNTQYETIPAQAALFLRQWVEAGLLVDTLQ